MEAADLPFYPEFPTKLKIFFDLANLLSLCLKYTKMKGIKFRLTLMNFLQFMIFGSWLISVSVYWFNNKGWDGTGFGSAMSSLGLASIIMPALIGIIADRWIPAQKLYGILHLTGAVSFFILSQATTPASFITMMFFTMFTYIPTLSLQNAVSYHILSKEKLDIVTVFPPIRVWGTIGFVLSMWIINLSGNKDSSNQFIFASILSLILGIYSFTLPNCPTNPKSNEKKSLIDALGLRAFKLFGEYRMALFFIFSMFLGVALQLTNMYGDTFINDFKILPQYADSFVVKYSTIFMSISQISETAFILTIPFFMKRFGIKRVIFISLIAWFLRFILFAYGNPDDKLWMIILSMIVYGMAFDFYNISGSLFIEQNTDSSMRSSAQGIFMMVSGGIGGFIGSFGSGILIDNFFTSPAGKDWQGIWTTFSIYILIITVLFLLFFKEKQKQDN